MTEKHMTPNRILHTMLRVQDLECSIDFYCGILGMQELRRQNYTDDRFTLVFLGYQSEDKSSSIELTYNWDETSLSHGNQFGHIALEVDNFEDMNALLMESGISYRRAPGRM